MTPEQLVDSITLEGGTLRIENGKLLFTAPAGYSAERKAEVMKALRGCKAGLVALLSGPTAGKQANDGAEKLRQASPAQEYDSYEVEPCISLHSPRMSTEFVEWRERIESYGRKDEAIHNSRRKR